MMWFGSHGFSFLVSSPTRIPRLPSQFTQFSLYHLYAAIRKVIEFKNNVLGAKNYNFFVVLVFSFVLMIFGSPFTSLFRVVFLVLRYFVNLVKEYFAKHMALQSLMTTFAIIAFIISNILQLIATYIE